MDFASVMRSLERFGKPNTIKIHRRHGVAEDSFGVSYAALARLVKQLRVNQELALDLWRSANHDARVLATRIADPLRLSRQEIESWLSSARNYVITDALSGLAARMPEARSMAKDWIDRQNEWLSAAGWNVLSMLALDRGLDEDEARELIERIRRGIRQARNRTRYAMNNTLIAIGGTFERLRGAALDAARAIAPVEVDHGETGCITPDAVATIEKMAKHQVTRARTTGARMKAAAAAKKAPAKKATAKKKTSRKTASPAKRRSAPKLVGRSGETKASRGVRRPSSARAGSVRGGSGRRRR